MKNKNASAGTDPAKARKPGFWRKEYWNKKKVLYWANGVCLVLIILYIVSSLCFNNTDFTEALPGSVIICIIIQVVFTFLSLIIYYLSIIADSLRYPRKAHGDNTDQKQQ